MKLGADDYLTKPFDDVDLIDVIEMRLKKYKSANRDFTRDMNGLNSFIDEARGIHELHLLSADRTVRKFRKKENVFYEGNMPHGLFFITSGKVKTYKTNHDGKEFITGLFKTGDFIGYMPLLEDANYNESAMAMEECEICMIPKQDFFKLINANRDVANRFIKMMSNNLIEVEGRIIQLAYNSVRKRVAEALILLKNKFEEDQKEEFSMNISRDDLANIVGTSPESVIRTLSDFKDEGIIEIKASRITIVNLQKLVNMKN
jgi:CRP-like cAMP-binding protein